MRMSVLLEVFDVEIIDLDLFRCGVCVFDGRRLEMRGFSSFRRGGLCGWKAPVR